MQKLEGGLFWKAVMGAIAADRPTALLAGFE